MCKHGRVQIVISYERLFHVPWDLLHVRSFRPAFKRILL